jgi:selenocysteine-specific elongation factor
MHIVGTAGHVDHGKSALIAALTGTNPDRLPQERARGMTLDLGFAHLRFADGVEAGIVDVPGHERFLHNMLAGAAGMELLLLVIDAVEGVMPQTVEHLQILQFLNVRRALAIVSKIDLIAPELRDAAVARIRAQLEGTIVADAPVLTVSATTGENLDALKTRLHDELASLPARNAAAPVYLPIDRVFSVPGLGTIVTGTLMQGSIATGERLSLEPGGITAHVRSIGVFDSTPERVEAGARVALSLPGVERARVARGQAVVGPELAARTSLRVRFVPLQSALPLLRRRMPVRAYFGSAEILGRLVLDEAAPGEPGVPAQLDLREPVVVFPGLRFVLRRPSPMTLLGGGHVEGIDVLSPRAAAGAGRDAVLAVLRERAPEAVELAEIASTANLREAAARDALARLRETGAIVEVTRPAAYVDGDAARALLAQTLATLEAAHRREPWALGLTSIALARALRVAEATFVRIADYFVHELRLSKRGGYYALFDHEPALTTEQRVFFDHLVALDPAQPLLPIPFSTAATAVRLSNVAGLATAFDMMLARGAFVKVGESLYREAQMAEIRARVAAHFRSHERMTAAQFRDLLKTSRKYAVPLLEWLDAREVTIRNGDYRTPRGER